MKVTMGDDTRVASVVRGWCPAAFAVMALAQAACGDTSDADTQTTDVAADTRDTTEAADTVDVDGAEVADTQDETDALDAAPGDAGPDAVTTLAYTPCSADVRVGVFKVLLADGYTAVEGRVASGVVPSAVRVETDREGACRLVEGRTLFCDPGCASGKTCDVDGTCIDYPTAKSVGVVTVNGLTVPLAMTPTSTGSYNNGATSIPHPGFAEGGLVTLSAPGDVLPGFALEGRGVAPLVVAQTEAALVRGQALGIDWTPGANASARLRLVLDLAHHGGIAASVECEGVDDDGSFEIPARLIDALIDIGVAGFPTLTLTRRTADSVTITPGCVELSVEHEVVVPVVVPGVTSCVSDEECPDGQTCQFDLTCG